MLAAIVFVTVCAHAADLKLHWSFNRTNNLFTFRYEATSNHYYGLVRYDIKEDYYDLPYYEYATNTGTVTFTLDPMITDGPDGNLILNPSGVCYFYMYDLHFPSGTNSAARGL